MCFSAHSAKHSVSLSTRTSPPIVLSPSVLFFSLSLSAEHHRAPPAWSKSSGRPRCRLKHLQNPLSPLYCVHSLAAVVHQATRHCTAWRPWKRRRGRASAAMDAMPADCRVRRRRPTTHSLVQLQSTKHTYTGTTRSEAGLVREACYGAF
jgi:hypothetical protein